jgi:uncharacterized protein
MPADDGSLGDALVERVLRLGRSLQVHGVSVALSEIIDAERAATAIDLRDREQLRIALLTTLVKDARHRPVFDAAFDRLFPARLGREHDGERIDRVEALAGTDDLAALAAELVDAFGGLDGELRGERHHIQRVFRGADLAKLMSDARNADPSLTAEDLRARIEQLKGLIAADVRAHLGEPDASGFDDATEDIEFLQASRAELEGMRQAVRPLARRLATRLARRRLSRRAGRVNMRRTARRSIGTGGVPIDLVLARPRAHRPELFVLCDISGSVADFSLFTLTLMAALSAEVPQTRTFVFVDAIDEITDLLASTGHGIEPWQIMRNTNVIAGDGHSDYGAVLRQFWDEVGERELRATSTVVIAGDGRTNHRPTHVRVLEQIANRARRVYWLNPEPRSEWNTHDSEIETYGATCDEVFEVRTLRQLVTCVENIL